MGYTTDFTGHFTIEPELRARHVAELTEFNETSHERYTGEGKPGRYCGWVPSPDGTKIEWDGGEKFDSYIPWIKWLIKNKLAPNGYVLNGSVDWDGEDRGDTGTITITDNSVSST